MPDRTVIQGVYLRRADGTVPLTRREFRYELQCCRDRCGGGWGSQPRACFLEHIRQELTACMVSWMLLEELDAARSVFDRPLSPPLRFHAAQFEAPLRKLHFGKVSRKEVPEL